jgi:hypothetical protein
MQAILPEFIDYPQHLHALVGEPPLLVFNDPNRGSCVGATRRSAVDGAVEVPCRGLRLMIAFFRVKYYIKYFL